MKKINGYMKKSYKYRWKRTLFKFGKKINYAKAKQKKTHKIKVKNVTLFINI